MFLNQEEIERLTGYIKPKCQCEHLKKNGTPFKVDAFGKPLVLKDYVNQMLGGIKKPRVSQPNFDALNG